MMSTCCLYWLDDFMRRPWPRLLVERSRDALLAPDGAQSRRIARVTSRTSIHDPLPRSGFVLRPKCGLGEVVARGLKHTGRGSAFSGERVAPQLTETSIGGAKGGAHSFTNRRGAGGRVVGKVLHAGEPDRHG